MMNKVISSTTFQEFIALFVSSTSKYIRKGSILINNVYA